MDNDEMVDDFYCICDDCEVKSYCRDIDKPHEQNNCIYDDSDSCYYYYDRKLDDIVERTKEESNKRVKEYVKIIKQRTVKFKRDRNYRKVN